MTIIAMLANYASMEKRSENAIGKDMKWSNGAADDEEKIQIPDVVHALLVFMDTNVLFLEESRKEFERRSGMLSTP